MRMSPEELWALHEFFVGNPVKFHIIVTPDESLCVHTCHNKLEIPSLVTDPEELYTMLVAAMAAERLFDIG